MKTIQEAVAVLQASIQEAIPGMSVAVNISLTPKTGLMAAGKVKNEVEQQTDKKVKPSANLTELRALLNSYVKKVGTKKAFTLVEKYTGGSHNPKDIAPGAYTNLIKDMGELTIDLDKDGKEAA